MVKDLSLADCPGMALLYPGSVPERQKTFHIPMRENQRNDPGKIPQHSRETQEVAQLVDGMSQGLEPRSAPSAALMMRTSLLPGERLEGAPPGLTLSPVPGTLRSEDIRQQEKNLFYPRINAVIQSASRL
ncbi:hypothetical protein D623_10012922 [Myotis brandtii]|uniref:Uncharacterized protein n=1 Tax=Myotis brandtii TaxID=109478 RepID=S7NLQ4_MYOBR|nr:hypothetical protein D623_10012922 [Myotis brandtii]